MTVSRRHLDPLEQPSAHTRRIMSTSFHCSLSAHSAKKAGLAPWTGGSASEKGANGTQFSGSRVSHTRARAQAGWHSAASNTCATGWLAVTRGPGSPLRIASSAAASPRAMRATSSCISSYIPAWKSCPMRTGRAGAPLGHDASHARGSAPTVG